MLKNTASQIVGAQLVSATDGSDFTDAVTCYVTGDGGTQAVGSVGSGACTHKGNGYHEYSPAQSETDYDHVSFTFVGTGALSATVQVYTKAGDAFTRLGAPAGASISADIAAVKAETASILTDTAEIGAAGAGLTALPWNSSWDAEVQSEVTDALTDSTAGAVSWQGVVDQGTAQSATSTTLVLRSAAGFADDELIGATILITGGSAGVGQARLITDYVSSTDTATVEAWTTTPTGTITYKVYATAPGSGGSGLDAAGIRAAIGLSNANLDTQLSTIDGNVDSILDDTGSSGVVVASGSKSGYSLAADQSGVTVGTVNALGTQAKADVNAEADSAISDASLATAANLAVVDSVADAIKADTAAVKTKTDSLTFTVAGQVDSTVLRIGVTDLQAGGTGGQGYGA